MKTYPEELVIQLNRFCYVNKNRTTKKNNIINVPLAVCLPNSNQTYKLFATVNHQGNFYSGHYTTAIKRANSNCTIFDDSRIYERPTSRLNELLPYILFYEKSNEMNETENQLENEDGEEQEMKDSDAEWLPDIADEVENEQMNEDYGSMWFDDVQKAEIQTWVKQSRNGKAALKHEQILRIHKKIKRRSESVYRLAISKYGPQIIAKIIQNRQPPELRQHKGQT